MTDHARSCKTEAGEGASLVSEGMVDAAVEALRGGRGVRGLFDGDTQRELVAHYVLEAALSVSPLVGERERLREECEKRGLPVSLVALLRHIENNHAATLGFKDLSIDTLQQQRDEARALLQDGERE